MSPRPGRITQVVDVPLAARNEDVREAPAFYATVTAVREALRGRPVPAGADVSPTEPAIEPRGVDLR